MIDPTKWVEYLKLQPKYILPVFLVCLFVLYAPDSILNILGLDKVLDEYRILPGILFILSFSVLLVHLLLQAYTRIQTQVRLRRETRQRRRALTSLSPAEKALLRQYMEMETKTMSLSIQDGVARGLEAVGILDRVSQLALGHSFSTPFNLQPWVWDELRENPELLD